MKRKAMTLTETLLALAILSLLMAVSLRVITVLNRTAGMVSSQDKNLILQTGLENLLTADFVHARRYRLDGDKVVLDCEASLDGKTLELKHLRSMVRYEIGDIQGRKCLVRIQQTEAGKTVEIVCFDAKKIKLNLAENIVEPNAWQNMPELIEVNVVLDDAGETTLKYKFMNI